MKKEIIVTNEPNIVFLIDTKIQPKQGEIMYSKGCNSTLFTARKRDEVDKNCFKVTACSKEGYNNLPTFKPHHIVLRNAEDFFPYFRKEITFEDNRSQAMRARRKGTLIGIRLDSVEIRVGNNITNWYPINSPNIIFIIS